ncbi:hypothetical protein CO614_03795 [Lysobacteraceae bacterium NML120232]|nr:hypothetical protein CO608_02675 [Xanthomonadaceae bacterium NML08-0793]PJK12680.1 hypothetical protein CO614_03795 [Xanthomonadaceae bacterium NML120232]
MKLPATLSVSAELHAFSIGVAVLVLLWAAWRLPWEKVRGDNEAQRIFAIFIAVMIVMRGLGTQSVLGVNLHFLGASIATLMFGARFALLALACISGAWVLLGQVWLGWGADFLINGALPVAVTVGIGLLMRKLPAHILIYVLGNGFFAAIMAMSVSIFAKALTTHLLGGNAMPYIAAAIPLSFAEGFFTGGVMALVVAYRPQWCASFDDDVYLAKRD